MTLVLTLVSVPFQPIVNPVDAFHFFTTNLCYINNTIELATVNIFGPCEENNPKNGVFVVVFILLANGEYPIFWTSRQINGVTSIEKNVLEPLKMLSLKIMQQLGKCT